MNETQLKVKALDPFDVFSYSNDPSFGGVGSIKIIVETYDIINTIVGGTITLYNNANNAQTVTVASIIIDSPSAGFTQISFSPALTYDFSQDSGGYYVDNNIIQVDLDLYENESISQNWAFTDLGTFAIQSPYTRQFRVPNTAKNLQIFEALNNTNFSKIDNFFFYRLPAEIFVDNIPIINGYVKLNKVYSQRDLITDYEITFFGKTSDFARDVNQKMLSDIDTDDLNPLVNFANVDAAAAGTLPYLFALCDRGQNWEAPTGRDIQGNIYAGDFTPCLKWSEIFDRIITQAGWTYKATDVINTIDSWWMPYINSRNIVYRDNLTYINYFRGNLSSDITLSQVGVLESVFQPTTQIADNNNRYSPGSVSTFTAPFSAEFNFEFRFVYTVIGSASVNSLANSVLRFFVENLTAGVTNQITEVVINPITTATNQTFSITGIMQNVSANTNDVLRLRVKLSPVPNYICNDIRIETDPTFMSYWALSGVPNPYEGFFFNFSANAPVMKQIDFITDVVKMMNLAVIEDPNIPKKLIFQNLSDFIGTGPSYDWTQKLDVNKDVIIYSTVDQQKAELYFTYTTGADAASKLYQQAGRTYGDLKIEGYSVNPDVPVSEFVTGKQDVKLVTQSTPSLNVASTHIPKFLDANGSFIVPGPRALFYSHTITLNRMFAYGNFITFEAPVLSHYSVENPSISDFDLNWAPEVPPFNIAANPYFTLFNLYWRDYLNSIYSPDARIMEAFFQLEITDITPVDFSSLIFIRDSYWRILEISDYKYGSQQSTKVKLFKVITPLLDCDITPVGMNSDGVILFENAEGESTKPNAICCTRYGYKWNEDSQTCTGLINPNQLEAEITSSASYNVISERLEDIRRSYTAGGNIQNDPTNMNTIISGDKITLDNFNSYTLAVGQNLKLEGANGSTALLGTNVLTKTSGLHIGGGYRDGTELSINGYNQTGIILFSKRPNPLVNNETFDLDIEGRLGVYLNLPDDTIWNCVLSVTINDGALANYETSLYSFAIYKEGGLAYASALTPLNLISTLPYTFTFDVDVVSNTDEHRINVNITGGTYPTTFFITANLQYQQNKIS